MSKFMNSNLWYLLFFNCLSDFLEVTKSTKEIQKSGTHQRDNILVFNYNTALSYPVTSFLWPELTKWLDSDTNGFSQMGAAIRNGEQCLPHLHDWN